MGAQIVPCDAEANYRQSLLDKIGNLAANMNLNRQRLEQRTRTARLRRYAPLGFFTDVSSTESADR